MVSAAQLQAQQRQLRTVRSGLSLQQQQQALRMGVSAQRFIQLEQEKIRQQVQEQITKQLKTQASNIDDILKNVNSISQFQELIKQVPPELRQFIKTNQGSLQRDLQNRIKQVQDKITSREREIVNLGVRRNEALQDDNQSKAAKLEAESRGLQKEINFLRGEALPRFQQGQLLNVRNVFEIAKDVGLAEEDKRKAIEQQLTKLSEKLEGGRRELSLILRTQEVTQQQAVQLGLLAPKQIELPSIKTEVKPKDIPKEILESKELLPGIVTQVPGGQPAFIKPEDVPPEFRDVFGDIKIEAPKIQKLKPGELLPGIVTQVPGGQPPLASEAELRRIEERTRRLTKKEFESLSFFERLNVGLDKQPLPEATLKERAGIFEPLVRVGGLGEPAFKVLEKGAEKISQTTEAFGLEKTTEFLRKDVPLVSRQEAIELLDLIIKFGIFSQFLTTGVAAKGKQAKKVQKTKQVKKLDNKTTKKIVDILEDSFKRGELKNDLIKLSDDIVKNTNKVQKNLQIQRLNSVLDEALRRGLIKNFFIDPKTGAIAFTDNAGSLFRVGTKLSPQLELQIQAILFEAPQISQQALVTTGVGVGFIEGKIPPFKELGKIGALDFGKIGGLGELGKIQDLDLQKIKNQAKEQQKNFEKLFEGILTTTKQTAKEREREKARQKELTKLGISQIEIPKLDQPTAQIPSQIADIIQKPDIITDIPTIQIPDITFPDITFEDPFPIPKFPTPQFPIPRPPTTPKKPPKFPPIIPFGFTDKELMMMDLPKFDEGFDLFVKSKGKRKKVESNINIDDTLDIGSFITDNSISQQFSFKETGKKAKPPKLQVPNNYWELNQRKFDNFRIKQGKIIPLKNTFIERRGNAIDTIGEIRGLSAARLLAEQRKQNREMDRMAKQLSLGFNKHFKQRKPKKQKTKKFKQFDITKTIKF